MTDLPKAYIPEDHEDKIYQKWEDSGLFNPDNLPAAEEPFSIAMPPPNVTGNLHVGHAMFLTLQDIMVRHARMRGKKALWLPGTDHAAIATNFVVERKLWAEEKKTRHDVGREEFLKLVDEWIKDTRGAIQNQIRKMGASCDWSREKYTLSPELSLAVRAMFKQMYDAGLIYRGKRIINWCPRCATTLADDEVEYRETNGTLYYIRYPLAEEDGEIVVATVRPETMLGDTAVAVHPDDKRYKKLIGQSAMLPRVNRELPIVADEAVDPDFGTGAVKVTPGHSAADFAIAERHNLEAISFITKEGKIDEQEALDHGFEDYGGLTVIKAREKVIADLKEAGFLQKEEDYLHNVGYCYRCETVVEPFISKQWFVNVNAKFKVQNAKFVKQLKLESNDVSLKEVGLQAVKSGIIKIVPERFEKNYLNWLENLHDWNISRQIWFGHQVPVWYKNDETHVGIEAPKEDGWEQDTDTLDTWFSSSLWTFSTLGWPDETEDLKLYHPTTIMETGYDIIFFWVARMVIMTGFAIEEIPFEIVYLHGMVRDEKGEKMNKTKGNVIDPLEMSEKYGTDALRLSLVLGLTPGQDLKISQEKIASYRNFANKLWNISRYIISANPKLQITNNKPEAKTLADEWIMAELDFLIQKINKHLDEHQYGLAGQELERFTWGKFADWYIEISKMTLKRHPREGGDPFPILTYVLQNLLRLWHPFIPFVTEHIWSRLSDDLLMIQSYPVSPPSRDLPKGDSIKNFEALQNLITGLRNLRAEYRVDPGKQVAAYVNLGKDQKWAEEQTPVIEHLARVRFNEEEVPGDKKMPYFIWEGLKVYLIVPDFDPDKEIGRAERELTDVKKVIKNLESQLNTKGFLEQAPEEVVEKLKSKFTDAKVKKEKLEQKIKSLK